jgi:hypothetical protein
MSASTPRSSDDPPWYDTVSFKDVVVQTRTVLKHGREVQQHYVSSISGHYLRQIKHGDLRVICSKLGVSGYKNKKKDDMSELIAMKKVNEELYDAVVGGGTAMAGYEPAKEPQCSFRVLNVLFSDEFAESFACLGDTRTRLDLDGAINREAQFWHSVRERFVDDSAADIAQLQFQHEKFTENAIDPGRIVHHSWRKLRDIYTDTRTAYRAAMDRFTASGTHDDDPLFFNFCAGRIDALYLHFHVTARPMLGDVVDAELPSDTFIDSESLTSERRSDSDGSSTSGTPAAKKRRINGQQHLTDTLAKFIETSATTAGSEQRAELYRKRDAREEARAHREQQQHEHQTALMRLEQWEKLSDRIRQLQRELINEIDPTIRAELEDDIQVMKECKRQISI